MSHKKNNAESQTEKKENFDTEKKTSEEAVKEQEVKTVAETEEKAAEKEKTDEAEKPAEDSKPEEKAEEKKPSPEQQKIDDLTDRLKRQMAEFENFRKRTEKEKADMFDAGARSVLEKILPVVDNFERGLANAPAGERPSTPTFTTPSCMWMTKPTERMKSSRNCRRATPSTTRSSAIPWSR